MKSPLGLEARLPITDLLQEAVQLLWSKRVDVMRLFFPVILLMTAVDFVNMTYFMSESDAVQQSISTQTIVSQLIILLFTILMATAAHRFTLLPRDQWPSTALRMFGRNEMRYLIRIIQVFAIACGIALPIIMLGFVIGEGTVPIFAVLGFMSALYVSGRLSITLPEIALGARTNLRRAWELGEGNGSRLIIVVVVIPTLMLFPFLALMQSESALAHFLGTFTAYLGSLLSVTILSLSYQFLHSFYAEKPTQNNSFEDNKETDQQSDQDSFDA